MPELADFQSGLQELLQDPHFAGVDLIRQLTVTSLHITIIAAFAQ